MNATEFLLRMMRIGRAFQCFRFHHVRVCNDITTGRSSASSNSGPIYRIPMRAPTGAAFPATALIQCLFPLVSEAPAGPTALLIGDRLSLCLWIKRSRQRKCPTSFRLIPKKVLCSDRQVLQAQTNLLIVDTCRQGATTTRTCTGLED